eukprot:g7928.t1
MSSTTETTGNTSEMPMNSDNNLTKCMKRILIMSRLQSEHPEMFPAYHLCNLNTCLNNNNECRNVCLARKDISKGFVKENVTLICCDEAKNLNKLHLLLSKNKLFRPVNCAFLDECCAESFWVSVKGAKADFPNCKIKEFITEGEILTHLIQNNLKPEDIKLYK